MSIKIVAVRLGLFQWHAKVFINGDLSKITSMFWTRWGALREGEAIVFSIYNSCAIKTLETA